MKFISFFASIAAVVALHAAPANASVTYNFYGLCSDCVLNSAPGAPIATLELTDTYAPGAALTLSDLIRFTYVGSDLVYEYVVEPQVLNLTSTQTSVSTYGAYFIGGSVDAPAMAYDFGITFDDGLVFATSSQGGWYTCAPGPTGYYNGTCPENIGNDFGRGQWNAAVIGNDVPEPSSLALISLAAFGAWSLRRRTKRV